ncbi:NAC domain-containing protein 58-like [Phragmites australis]|uniref:NAC domain-containing protein 58-like n=1 Tax=Phragmites australis TaxID=29695 RepID=UPI002D7A315C|nr:NAC domain-containing protein 58-like [Phragmites australis]
MAWADGWLTKHGFPRGYRFVPEILELFAILSDRIGGRPLPPKVAGVFNDIRILDHHPRELYEAYKEYEEKGNIYFFSLREFPPGRAGGGDNGKERRPVRTATGGAWKSSGGSKQLSWPPKKGSGVAGRMVTMVFYERQDNELAKTDWGMHEFTVPIGPNLQFSDLAVYRLYELKNGGKESKTAARSRNEQANSSDHGVATVSVEHRPSTLTVVVPRPGQSRGTFTTTNQALAAASTSQTWQQPGIEHAQLYHHPYSFGAAATSGPCNWAPLAAANPQAQKARAMSVHGAGSPGYFQFAGPPAPVPVSPAAENPAAQQDPAAATHGVGQAGHFGATRSPPATPAAASPPAEQHAAATASPLHVQVAGCDVDESMEASVPSTLEVVPPLPELAPAAEDDCMDDAWNSCCRETPSLSIDTDLGSLDDFFLFDNSYDSSYDISFTMEELTGQTLMPTPMEAANPSGGDENSQADGKQQQPPS